MGMSRKPGIAELAIQAQWDDLQALSKVLPVVAKQKLAAGGYMILRPDSGDPVEAVLLALRCCHAAVRHLS